MMGKIGDIAKLVTRFAGLCPESGTGGAARSAEMFILFTHLPQRLVVSPLLMGWLLTVSSKPTLDSHIGSNVIKKPTFS